MHRSRPRPLGKAHIGQWLLRESQWLSSVGRQRCALRAPGGARAVPRLLVITAPGGEVPEPRPHLLNAVVDRDPIVVHRHVAPNVDGCRGDIVYRIPVIGGNTGRADADGVHPRLGEGHGEGARNIAAGIDPHVAGGIDWCSVELEPAGCARSDVPVDLAQPGSDDGRRLCPRLRRCLHVSHREVGAQLHDLTDIDDSGVGACGRAKESVDPHAAIAGEPGEREYRRLPGSGSIDVGGEVLPAGSVGLDHGDADGWDRLPGSGAGSELDVGRSITANQGADAERQRPYPRQHRTMSSIAVLDDVGNETGSGAPEGMTRRFDRQGWGGGGIVARRKPQRGDDRRTGERGGSSDRHCTSAAAAMRGWQPTAAPARKLGSRSRGPWSRPASTARAGETRSHRQDTRSAIMVCREFHGSTGNEAVHELGHGPLRS